MSDLPPVIYVGHHDWHHKPIDGWKPYVPVDRIAALEAENARLREALRRIVSTSQAMSADYICNGGESGHERTARIAFAALTPETDNE